MASKPSTRAGTERTALILQGILAILFGIVTVFWPGLTTLALVYLLATFLLVDGVIALVWGLVKINYLVAAFLIILLGLVELGVGLYLIRRPEVALETLLIVLGIILIARGVFSFAHAIAGKGPTGFRAMHAILGLLGVTIGIIIMAQPVASGLAFVWLLGLYALICGPVMIAMSARLSKA